MAVNLIWWPVLAWPNEGRHGGLSRLSRHEESWGWVSVSPYHIALSHAGAVLERIGIWAPVVDHDSLQEPNELVSCADLVG